MLPMPGGMSMAAQLTAVVDDFAEEVGGPPTLGELLEILGWGASATSESMTAPLPVPLVLKAKLKGNRRYGSGRPSRIGELNDAVFAAASDLLQELAEAASARNGAALSPAGLAAEITSVLHESGVHLDDVEAGAVAALSLDVPKRRPARPRRGDLLAIPGKAGDSHLALVLERNRIGTALGLLRGTRQVPRTGGGRPDVVHRPVFHTDDAQIAAGVWKTVAHDERLLDLFPGEPEIYHGAQFDFTGVDLGEFGAAEAVESGELRLVGKDEAKEVGLLDRTYRQVWMSEHLQETLADGALPGTGLPEDR